MNTDSFLFSYNKTNKMH